MTIEQIKHEISRLDLAEKLHLVGELWDSIAETNSDIPLQDWQKEELDRRYQECQAGKVELREWGAVHEELREKYK